MCKELNPCYNCNRRRATSEYNCHSDCPDYKEYKEKLSDRANVIRHKKADEAMVTDVRIRSMQRTSGDKRRQGAWKG